MTCPECGYQLPELETECQRCARIAAQFERQGDFKKPFEGPAWLDPRPTRTEIQAMHAPPISKPLLWTLGVFVTLAVLLFGNLLLSSIFGWGRPQETAAASASVLPIPAVAAVPIKPVFTRAARQPARAHASTRVARKHKARPGIRRAPSGDESAQAANAQLADMLLSDAQAAARQREASEESAGEGTADASDGWRHSDNWSHKTWNGPRTQQVRSYTRRGANGQSVSVRSYKRHPRH